MFREGKYKLAVMDLLITAIKDATFKAVEMGVDYENATRIINDSIRELESTVQDVRKHIDKKIKLQDDEEDLSSAIPPQPKRSPYNKS